MYRQFFFLCFLAAVSVLTSCDPEPIIVDGMRPVYQSATDFSSIGTESPRAFQNLGNFATVGDYIFAVEKHKGIHVMNNSDPTNPITEYFWNIPGTTQFTIDENVLYADNSIHLLVIDISDFSMIEVLDYIADIYIINEPVQPKPPNYEGPFDCVDRSKGIVINWELVSLTDPLCDAFL